MKPLHTSPADSRISAETARRLSLGLYIVPAHSNRRRRNLRLSLTTRILTWLERHCSLI